MEKIMKLTEHKNEWRHYFQDENGLKQGEYKRYYSGEQLWIHYFYKDGKRHGECKEYNEDGSLDCKKYYSNGKDVTDMYLKLEKWKSL